MSASSASPETIELRRRRALWRASHRGTKELDWLLGRFAQARLAAMDGSALGVLETLLALPEPQLQDWLIGGAPAPADARLAALVREIRAFHGL